MNARKRLLLDGLIRSLRDDPRSWNWRDPSDRSPSTIIHASGICLWVWSGSARVHKPREIHFGLVGYLRLRSAFRSWRSVHGNLSQYETDAIEQCLTLLRIAGKEVS